MSCGIVGWSHCYRLHYDHYDEQCWRCLDNSKKFYKKLDVKKLDQGKARVVGDTIGDPPEDMSDSSLNILIKLIFMISLIIASMLAGRPDGGLNSGGHTEVGRSLMGREMSRVFKLEADTTLSAYICLPSQTPLVSER